MKFCGVAILQGVEIPIFVLIFEWPLQQCSATALPVMYDPLNDLMGHTAVTISVAELVYFIINHVF